MADQSKLLTVLESEEQSVPETLEMVIRNIEKHFDKPTESHLLLGVIYTLMLECGFRLSSNNGDNQSDETHHNDQASNKLTLEQSLSFNYKNIISQSDLLSDHISEVGDALRVPFKLFGIPEYYCILMLIPSGSQRVVNLLILKEERIIDCYSHAFTSSSFLDTPNSILVAKKFRNLKLFSIQFKDSIAHKGRSFLLNRYQILNESLEGMPEDIFVEIIEHIHLSDMENLIMSSSIISSKITLEMINRKRTKRERVKCKT